MNRRQRRSKKTDIRPKTEEQRMTRKAFKTAVMPSVGTIIDEKHKVGYVHHGQFRFTATPFVPDQIPPLGTELEWDGKKYKVLYHIPESTNFSATFTGFVEHPTEIPDVGTDGTEVATIPETNDDITTPCCDCGGECNVENTEGK